MIDFVSMSGAELVALNVRRIREERGLSQGELARRAGLSKQTLSNVEAGEGNPTTETLLAVAGGLEVSASWLLTESETPSFIQRADAAIWEDAYNVQLRVLGQVYGAGDFRSSLMRLTRGPATSSPATLPQLPTGALSHVYVITGRVVVGSTRLPVEVARGDFVRFPVDVPHIYRSLTATALLHVVTSIPRPLMVPGLDSARARPGDDGTASGTPLV
jgi:transcriptional regulator with XRE-family HTH domain